MYLHNLLKPLNKTLNLRSSHDDQLVVPRVSSKMGERAFSVATPPPPTPSSGIVSLLRSGFAAPLRSRHRGFRRIRSFSFHLFFHFLAHSFIIVFVHLFIHLVARTFVHSFVQSFIHSFIYSFTYTFTHFIVHSFIYLFNYSFIHLFATSFICIVILFFTHTFNHLVIF